MANFAGASGPMAIGVGGAAGDAYDALRHYLPNPALGPHDPTTAVELAALVLIKDKGAPTGQPIDAYWRYAEAYNGSGPAAAAYADRVIADAHAYQGSGHRWSRSPAASAAPGGYINPFNGEAWAPSRNDQGVDYDPLKVEPVRAIGAGTIVDIGSWGSYGPWFDYKLAGGRFAGKCIYVAEHIGSILAPGTQLQRRRHARHRLPGPLLDRMGISQSLQAVWRRTAAVSEFDHSERTVDRRRQVRPRLCGVASGQSCKTATSKADGKLVLLSNAPIWRQAGRPPAHGSRLFTAVNSLAVQVPVVESRRRSPPRRGCRGRLAGT